MSVDRNGNGLGNCRSRGRFHLSLDKFLYISACQSNGGGAYLRREGLYSSLISEWRKQRDAGVLDGKKPGEKTGKLTAEQAEIARLTRELERANKKLATTQTALGIMGKAHELLEQLSESTNTDEQRKKR